MTETHSYGQGDGHKLIYRSSEIRVRTTPKLRLEIIVNEFDADEVVDAIASAVVSRRAGSPDEGKIFVVPLDQYVDVADREREALPVHAR